jgi:hypothetical protein
METERIALNQRERDRLKVLHESEQLRGFLQRIADEQGLTPGVHPGFSRLGGHQKRSR